MIAVQKLTLQFGGQVLFEDISFSIRDNDRIGLVGKNGAGKSTLLKIFAGLQQADSGSVIIPSGYSTGYLPQELQHLKGRSLFEETRQAFEEALAIDKALHALQHELETRKDVESAAYHAKLDTLHTLTHRMELLDVNSIDKQIELVLGGLGFERDAFDRPVETFSGGWQMRIALAKILLKKPELVLLDEPTNHLDIESIRWLEQYLKNYPGAVLLVSHDRVFLDTVTIRTIEIVNRKIYDYPAPYSRFVELRREHIEQQLAAQKNQEKEIRSTEQLIEKFRYKASKAKFAQTLIHRLENMERVEVDDEETAGLHFRFPEPPRSGKIVAEAVHLHKQYGENVVLRDMHFTIERGDKIAFVGRNGEGKSTLSRILAGKENYSGTLRNGTQVSLGYYAQNQADQLGGEDSVFDVIDKTATGDVRARIRKLLGAFLFSGDTVFKKVKVLSGGEKSRLALCKLLLEPHNFLILDEPTNHLDMRSKEILRDALKHFHGTVIVVSHDRDFLKGLTTRVFAFRAQGIREYPGDIYDFLRAEDEAFQMENTDAKQKKESAPSAGNRENYEKKKLQERRLKKLQKEIKEAEEEIEKAEQEIAFLEERLKDPAFYHKHKNDTGIFSEYELLKQSLAEKMERWEALHMQLEESGKESK